jgi:acetyltransferase-like isoleucine patch superfamily enzyme
MCSIGYLYKRFRHEQAANRLGPDMPFTHWRLYIRSLAIELCRAKFARFDEGAEFRPGAFAIGCSNIKLGRRVVIRPQTMLFADMDESGASIEIADNALVGSGVHIYVGNHQFNNPEIPIIDQGRIPSTSVLVDTGAWIGACAIILPGVTVGRNAVVGAGSVVTKPVEPATLVAGNPARLIRKL